MTQPSSYSQLIKDLAENEKELEYITRGICRDTGVARLLLVIDQFEEVFTQTADEHKRQRFFDSLLNTVEAANSPTLIVLTMRSDFLGKCAAYADLNTFIIDHLFQIGPMSAKDLREAIEAPAQRVGLEFEKGLVEIMLRDAAGAPGELPLIEHALLELYERRSGNQLTQAAYVEIGGISGALAKRAEAEFARLTPAQQEILRKMFVLRLIQPGEGTEDTRRRATKEELLAAGGSAKEAETVLQQWTNARLLTTTRDEEKKQELVDVAHEALIRTWPTVQKWLVEDRETSRLLSLVRHATQEWQASDKSADYLWLGAQLARAEELHARHSENLTKGERDFILASVAGRERSKKRRKQLFGSFLTFVLIALVAVSILAIQFNKANIETSQQLMHNYWENGRKALEEGKQTLALHYMTEAILLVPEEDYLAQIVRQDIPEHFLTPFLYSIMQHNDWVWGAKFDPDEKRILTWSRDGSACLWDTETGRKIGKTMRHGGTINGALFNKTGKRILTWGDESNQYNKSGTARLWDAESGEQTTTSMQHEGSVSYAMFDKTEKRILTIGGDKSVCLWDAKTGKQIGKTMQHESDVKGAMFDQAENRILTWSGEYRKPGSVRLWDAETGEQIGKTIKHESQVNGAIFDRVGKRILSWSDDGSARLWDTETRKQIGKAMQHESSVKGAMFDQTEKRILSWSAGFGKPGSVRLWNAKTGGQIGKTMQHESPVGGALFDLAEKRILTWSGEFMKSGNARLWNAETGKQIGKTMQHGSFIKGAMFDLTGNRILTWSDEFNNSVRLWDAETGNQIDKTIQHPDPNFGRANFGVAFDLVREHVLTWNYGGYARMWEVKTSEQIGRTMQHEIWILDAVFDRAGKRILTRSSDGSARLWIVGDGDRTNEIIYHENVNYVSFYRAETRILTSSGSFTVSDFAHARYSVSADLRLWNAQTGGQVGKTMKHENSIKGVLLDRSENRILTWARDFGASLSGTAGKDNVYLWDAETGDMIGKPMRHENLIGGAMFDKPERRILTWSDRLTPSGSVHLWDAATGNQIGQTMQHNVAIIGATFDEAEKRILTCSRDGYIHFWSAGTGEHVNRFSLNDDTILGVVFDHTGRRALTWLNSNYLRLWDAESGKQIGKTMYNKGAISGAIFDRAEKRILSWAGGSVQLWEAATGIQIGKTIEHKAAVHKAIFDQAERRILTWSRDRAACLWDVKTGEQIGRPMKHEGSVLGAIFYQGEKRILTWSNDGGIRLWDAETGNQISKTMRHKDLVIGAAFDREGKRILSWSQDGSVRLWDVPGDLDCPAALYPLQVQALTGTYLDLNTREVKALPAIEWKKIQAGYLIMARQHAAECEYPRQNVYLRFFPTEEK